MQESRPGNTALFSDGSTSNEELSDALPLLIDSSWQETLLSS